MHATPHNLEAEQGFLGAILYDNLVLKSAPQLTPAMFFEPLHGRIYGVMLRRQKNGQASDAVTMRAEFADDETIKEMGGAAYFLTLLDCAPTLSRHAIGYGEAIRDCYWRREFIAIAERAASDAQSLTDSTTFPAIVAQTEQSLRSIVAGGGASDEGLDAVAVRVAEELRKPVQSGLRTGLRALDRLIGGLFDPDLIVLAGRPAMGKTAIATNLAVNVAQSQKVDEHGVVLRNRVVGFFSLEMGKDQLAMRALSRRSGEDGFAYSDFRSERFRPNADRVHAIANTLPPSLRIDDRGTHSVASIQSAARDIRSRYKALDLIVVDYLQLMEDARGAKDGRVQEVSAITKGLKALAKELRCPVVALSQLSRNVENRQDKRPQLSDLRESGSIEQDADSVLFAFREHYYLTNAEPKPREDEDETGFGIRRTSWERRCAETRNRMEIIAGKNRHGPTGACELWCDLSHDAIADVPEQTDSSPPSTRRPYYLRDE